MFNEEVFKTLIQEAVSEAMNHGQEVQYEGFADVEKFIEISGISKHDLEEKLIPHPQFKQHVYRLEGRKRYIDVHPALNSIREIMKRGA